MDTTTPCIDKDCHTLALPDARPISLYIAYGNARVWTGAGPDTRTDAIGITGERIAAIGADAVRARIGKRTQVIDLDGAFVTPGFIDAHVHFVKAATMLSPPSLRDAENPKEFVGLEERRVGNGRVSTWRARWSTVH